jgi:hypothetical protein
MITHDFSAGKYESPCKPAYELTVLKKQRTPLNEFGAFLPVD